MPHNMIRYVLGATGQGRQQLRLHPGAQLSYIDYVFIENDEDVGPGCCRIRFSTIRWICWSIVIAQRLGAGCPLRP